MALSRTVSEVWRLATYWLKIPRSKWPLLNFYAWQLYRQVGPYCWERVLAMGILVCLSGVSRPGTESRHWSFFVDGCFHCQTLLQTFRRCWPRCMQRRRRRRLYYACQEIDDVIVVPRCQWQQQQQQQQQLSAGGAEQLELNSVDCDRRLSRLR